MTIGNDFIGDRRFWLVITISNAHLCPPGAERSLARPPARSLSMSDSSFRCTGWSVWGPGRRTGQVWALLFSLPVSISHLLALYSCGCVAFLLSFSPSRPLPLLPMRRDRCAFTSVSILILISSVAFSSSSSTRGTALRAFLDATAYLPLSISLSLSLPRSVEPLFPRVLLF